MAYKTTQPIRDTKDVDSKGKKRYYRKGAAFPREGLEVTQDRLDELITGGFIVSDESVEELKLENTDLSKLKKDELLGLANKKGVEVSENNTKAEIVKALEG